MKIRKLLQPSVSLIRDIVELDEDVPILGVGGKIGPVAALRV